MSKRFMDVALFPLRSQRSGSSERNNQRKYNRYEVGASVAFQWRDLKGVPRQGAGFMRDISNGGLFVLTPTLPPIGSKIRLEICLEYSPTDSPIAIFAKGNVCRVEPSEQSGAQRGFAASTKRLKLHRPLKQQVEDSQGSPPSKG